MLSKQIPDRYRSRAFCWGERERGLDDVLCPGSPAWSQAVKVVVDCGAEHVVTDHTEELDNHGRHEMEI